MEMIKQPAAPIDAELLTAARKIVCEHRRASISLVQRRLFIRYNLAAVLLEMLERDGVVSPMSEEGHRKVLVTA